MQTSNRKIEYVTVVEAAKLLKVTHITVRYWIKKDWLPSYRIGPKLLRISLMDILALKVAITEIRQRDMFGNLNQQRGAVIARTMKYPSRTYE